MIRAFIAARIPENPHVRRLNARLSEFGEKFRPVALASLHVTLKFLGDTDEAQVPEISAILRRIAGAFPACDVRLSGLGAFPHVRRPSAVWLGLHDAPALGQIAERLDRELESVGFAPERRAFQPHLTLLRVRSRPPEGLFSMLAELSAADFGTAHVGSVELFQSQLQKGGSQYTVLSSAALGAAGVGR